MKDLEILDFLKVLQSNKPLILEKASCKVNKTELLIGKLRFYNNRSICGNMWENLGYSSDLKDEYFESWDSYSGSEGYPVSGKVVYESLENFWVGKQAKLRFSLIDHLVKCYSEQLGVK